MSEEKKEGEEDARVCKRCSAQIQAGTVSAVIPHDPGPEKQLHKFFHLCEGCKAQWDRLRESLVSERMKRFLVDGGSLRRDHALQVAASLIKQADDLNVGTVMAVKTHDAECLAEEFREVHTELLRVNQAHGPLTATKAALEQKVEELEGQLEQAKEKERLHECAPPVTLATVRTLVRWGLEAGADPSLVRGELCDHYSEEVLRLEALDAWRSK